MKKRVLLISILLLLIFVVRAAYFEKIPYKITQPDGNSINCYISGDEFFNWIHDDKGYTIIQAQNGYYYYAERKGDSLQPSKYLVNSVQPSNVGLSKWAKISKSEYQQRRDAMFSYQTSGNEGPDNAPHSGTLNNVVIYIRFSDESEFTTTRQVYDDKFNLTTGVALKSYFKEVSYNSLIINSSHYPTSALTTNLSYQDTHPRSYFQPYNATTNLNGYSGGANGTERTTREHQLLVDVINWINTNSPVSTSLNIDGDGDSKVDNVCFIIKGSSDGWSELLWAHRWSLYSQYVYINGKRVYDYTFQPESQVSVQTLCHEMFHALGSPDLYHYNDGGLNISPVSSWDLMESGGGHMSAYMKWKYSGQSWITSIPEILTTGTYTLNPLTSSTNNSYKIASPNSTFEYFVVEYRNKSGTFESNIPGSGLLVYRIDTRENGNASGPPDEVYIYRPGGTTTVNGTPASANFSSNVGRTAINNTTNPNCFLQDGSSGGLNISNVTTAGATISFYVSIPVPCTPPLIQATNFNSSAINDNTMTLNWTRGNGNSVLVVARKQSSIIEIPVNGTYYTANSAFGNGNQIGNGNYVIYNGTGTSVNLTSLTQGSVYNFEVYEYNTLTNCYLTPALSGTATTTGIAPCSYCASTGNVSYQTSITSVSFNSINNISAKPSAYNDYTAISTSVNKSSLYNLSVNVNTDGNYTVHAFVWIDWNQDCDFLDADEIYDLGTAVNIANGITSLSPLSITIPATALNGNTRMRVSAKYNSDAASCDNSYDGEVEDYTVNVLPALCIPPSIQASSFTSSTILTTSFTAGWNRGNGNALLVIARQGSSVNSEPLNGNNYTANSSFGSGSQIGSGNYVVYSGNATSCNISGLIANTNYYFAIYEYNNVSNCYKTPALTANLTTAPICTAVAIISQPETNITSCSPSSNISFTVGATTGTTSITYQWQYFNGNSWLNVSNGIPTGASYSNSTTATLSINGVITAATHQYRCYLTNCNGDNSAISNIANLTVKVTPSVNNISSQTICSGENTILVTPISTPSGATINWTAEASIGINAISLNGTNSIPAQTINNTTTTSGTVTYSIVPSLNSCTGNPYIFVVNINPKPNIPNQTTTILSGMAFMISPSQIPSGTTYKWTTPTYTGGVSGGSIQNTPISYISQTLFIATGTGTATYNITPTSGNCIGNSFTGIVTVTKNCTPVTITNQPITSQTICNSYSNATLSVIASGPNPITYQWKYNDNGNWVNVSNGIPAGAVYNNGTSSTMTVNGISILSTYQYRCFLSNCFGTNNVTSDISEVIVKVLPSAAGNIIGISTVNQGQNNISYIVPVIANATSYAWSIPNGASGSSSSNSISINFNANANSGYISVKGINSCGEGTNSNFMITVNPFLSSIHLKVSNALSQYIDETIISYGYSTDIGGSQKINSTNVLAPTLYSTKLNKNWSINYLTNVTQHPIVPIGFKAGINGTYSITVSEMTSFIPTTYIYLRDLKTDIVTELNQNTIYSFTATINDSANRFQLILSPQQYKWLGNFSDDWANVSNWTNNALPGSSDDVILNSWTKYQPHVTMPFTNAAVCLNLTINQGSNITIDAGKALTVYGNLYNNAGIIGLNIKSDAMGSGSLLHKTAGTPASVERFISHVFSDEYHMLSSMVSSQAISAGFNQTEGFYVWDEPTANWIDYNDTLNFFASNGSSNFIPGKGYAVSYPTTVTKYFSGFLNQGNITIPLSYTTNLYSGWNFIGNPYPSSINWNSSNGWNRNILENAISNEKAIWVWNSAFGNYGAYISNSSLGTNGVNNNIASSQGFWVKTTSSGTMSMTDEIRIHSSQPYLKTTNNESDVIRLIVKKTNNNYSDEIIIKFVNNSDIGGAEKLFSTNPLAPGLYTKKFNKNWSINLLSAIDNNSLIPVGFKAGENGNYNIHVTGIQTHGTVLIDDLKTGIQHNLSINNNFSFTAQPNDNQDRFLLHLNSTSINETITKSPTIFYNNQSLSIFNPWSGKSLLEIYDINSRLIQSFELHSYISKFNISFSQGIYIIKLMNEKKIFIKKEVVY
ncbi:MAG: M6 family metalloprotease domain-containing protein [Bacteroidales bacterium]